MDGNARFRELFESSYEAVRSYVYHRGVAEGAADDIVAETFLVAWRRLDDVPADDPLPWLMAVARNVWLNQRRGTGGAMPSWGAYRRRRRSHRPRTPPSRMR